MVNMDPKWLKWAKDLQAISQIGLTFTTNHFEIERYEAVREIAAEIIALHSDLELNYIRGLFASELGYATPKVDVRGVLFRDDSILLVQEREDSCWTLPGGWADVNESPNEAVVREVHEESGYHTQAVKLLAIYDRSKHPHTPPFPYHVYKLFFQCEIIGGDKSRSRETSDVAFFQEDRLPALSLSRVTPAQIARLFEHYRHPDLPTDFD